MPNRRLLAAALLLGLLAAASSQRVLPGLAISLASGKAENASYNVNVNKIVDNNIEYIRSGLRASDPKDLRDISRFLNKKIYVKLHTGWLQHLSKLQRSGDCALRYTNKVLTLDIDFEWDDLVFNYRYLLKLLLIKKRGDLHGQMTKIKMNIVVDVDLKKYEVVLKRLHFIDASRVKIWIKGGILQPIYNLFLKFVTKVAKSAVLRNIQDTTIELVQLDIDDLNEILAKRNLPRLKFVNAVPALIDDSVNDTEDNLLS